MKQPLYYAILKYMTKVEEASADDVIEALKDEYGHYKAMKKPAVVEALMTGEANGLLEESRYELNKDGDLVVYFRAHEEGAATINSYIPN